MFLYPWSAKRKSRLEWENQWLSISNMRNSLHSALFVGCLTTQRAAVISSLNHQTGLWKKNRGQSWRHLKGSWNRSQEINGSSRGVLSVRNTQMTGEIWLATEVESLRRVLWGRRPGRRKVLWIILGDHAGPSTSYMNTNLTTNPIFGDGHESEEESEDLIEVKKRKWTMTWQNASLTIMPDFQNENTTDEFGEDVNHFLMVAPVAGTTGHYDSPKLEL